MDLSNISRVLIFRKLKIGKRNFIIKEEKFYEYWKRSEVNLWGFVDLKLICYLVYILYIWFVFKYYTVGKFKSKVF